MLSSNTHPKVVQERLAVVFQEVVHSALTGEAEVVEA
jgi:hypothetical protein